MTTTLSTYSAGLDRQSAAMPKDDGDVTITVKAQAWIYNPMGPPQNFDELTDTLTVHVEALKIAVN